jgi:hypothetical protein
MNINNLRIRKITKQEKYKIYDITTGDTIKIYDSRKLAHNALKRMNEKEKKVRFNENADVVIVHIKDGDKIKEKIKEKIKK